MNLEYPLNEENYHAYRHIEIIKCKENVHSSHIENNYHRLELLRNIILGISHPQGQGP